MSSILDASTDLLTEQLDRIRVEVDTLASLPPTAAGVEQLGRLLVEVETLTNRLHGISAAWTSEFETAGGPQDHGAPSLNVWCRRELRVTPVETRRRTRRAAALAALPDTGAALAQGRINLAQVDAIAFGVHQMGPETMAAVEPALLEIAQACDADAVRQAVQKTRETLDPDAADAAYIRALERRDITVTQVGEGFDVRGFLDPVNGAAFKTMLAARSVKTSVDDDRTAGQRRADVLGELSTAVLQHGLPTDRGLRPQVFVTVPADRLRTVTQGTAPEGEPAVLAGFGEIGDKLLAQVACDCAITPSWSTQPTRTMCSMSAVPNGSRR